MREEGFDDDYLPAPTHQRKARKLTAQLTAAMKKQAT